MESRAERKIESAHGFALVSLYVGDKSPKALPISIALVGVNGTTVASVRVRGVRPSGVAFEWIEVPTSTTATQVQLLHVFAADGSDLPENGSYKIRAWCYDSGNVQVYDTDEALLPVIYPDAVAPP